MRINCNVLNIIKTMNVYTSVLAFIHIHFLHKSYLYNSPPPLGVADMICVGGGGACFCVCVCGCVWLCVCVYVRVCVHACVSVYIHTLRACVYTYGTHSPTQPHNTNTHARTPGGKKKPKSQKIPPGGRRRRRRRCRKGVTSISP